MKTQGNVHKTEPGFTKSSSSIFSWNVYENVTLPDKNTYDFSWWIELKKSRISQSLLPPIGHRSLSNGNVSTAVSTNIHWEMCNGEQRVHTLIRNEVNCFRWHNCQHEPSPKSSNPTNLNLCSNLRSTHLDFIRSKTSIFSFLFSLCSMV